MKKWIGKGLKNLVEGSPNKNVINILRSLIEDKNCTCYIPLTYTSERKTILDPKVHFQPIEAGKTIIVTGVQSNQERFNFSITGNVDVYVEYEHEDGSVELVPKKIFRTYTIIRDGQLTINYLIAKLSENAFIELRNAGILYYNGMKVMENHSYVPDFLYKVDLTNMRIISYAWAQPMQIGLYNNMEEENKLSNTLKEVNKLIKKYKEEGQDVPIVPEDNIYYNEPYLGEERKGEKVECSCVVYTLKNDKSVISEYIDNATDLVAAIRIKKEINKKLKNIRFLNRCVIWAIEESKTKGGYNWSELKPVPRSKDKFYQITILENGVELKRTIYTKEF